MAALLRAACEASTSSRLISSLLSVQARSFRGTSAALAKGKGKGTDAAPSGAKATAVPSAGMSATHCSGINYKKGGSDPELGPDEDYPDWLWTLLEPKKSLLQLEKEVAAAKLTGRYDVMALEDVKRLLKLRRRAKIKANNAARAK